jgi:hypothetical protein
MRFNLNKNQFRTIIALDCVYCDAPPTASIKSVDNRRYKYLPPTEPFKYNGVDRLDSSGHYTPDNCVPCCKMCNYAKRDMPAKDFISWLYRTSSDPAERVNNFEKKIKAVELLLQPLKDL